MSAPTIHERLAREREAATRLRIARRRAWEALYSAKSPFGRVVCDPKGERASGGADSGERE